MHCAAVNGECSTLRSRLDEHAERMEKRITRYLELRDLVIGHLQFSECRRSSLLRGKEKA